VLFPFETPCSLNPGFLKRIPSASLSQKPRHTYAHSQALTHSIAISLSLFLSLSLLSVFLFSFSPSLCQFRPELNAHKWNVIPFFRKALCSLPLNLKHENIMLIHPQFVLCGDLRNEAVMEVCLQIHRILTFT
jgi:hypothetical protein